VIEPLELLREGAAEGEREAGERDLVVFRGFEDVDAALVGGAEVVDLERAIETGARGLLRGLVGAVGGRCGGGRRRRTNGRLVAAQCAIRAR